jgi:hypothetical protein
MKKIKTQKSTFIATSPIAQQALVAINTFPLLHVPVVLHARSPYLYHICLENNLQDLITIPQNM